MCEFLVRRTGAQRPRVCVLAAALALALGPSGWVQAQVQVQLNSAELKGKLSGIAPGMLEIALENGNRWVVNLEGKLGPRLQLAEKPTIVVRGMGTPRILAPGYSVRFPAKLDRKNATLEDIAAIELFNPDASTLYGLLPVGLEGDEEPAAKRKAPLPEVREVRVSGKVASLKNDVLTVAYPGGTVKAKLVETCLVNFETADYSRASVGDTIEAQIAYHMPPNAVALRVEITKVGVLGSEPEKPKRAPPVKPAGKEGAPNSSPNGKQRSPFEVEGDKPDDAKPEDGKPAPAKAKE